MTRLVVIAAVTLLFSITRAQIGDTCLERGYTEIPLSDIFASTTNGNAGVLEIDDGYGVRQIKVEKLEWNNCPDDPSGEGGATGTATPGGTGLTTISMLPEGSTHSSGAGGGQHVGNGECRINNSTLGGRQSHWYPIQGLKVTFLGWKARPDPILVSDVDMEGHSIMINNLRKAALVFGFIGNDLYNATWTFPSDSQLIEHTNMIQYPSLTTASPSGFGFTRATNLHAWFKGVQTTYETAPVLPDSPLTCEGGTANTTCGAYFSFNDAVDGFVILAAQEWKSIYKQGAYISVSALKMPCGCRCKTTDDSGIERTVTLPTSTANMCERKMITDEQFVCDSAGEMWCSRKEFDRYVITSSESTNGLYPCEKSTGVKVQKEYIFGSAFTSAV